MPKPKFKHFQEGEVAIVERFLEKQLLPGKTTFDVPLRTISEKHLKMMVKFERESFKYRTSKKIDFTVETKDAVWIIEVKWKIRPSAIGQLLVYRDMYRKQYKPIKPIRLGILATQDDEHTRKVAEKQKIATWIV